MGGAQRYPSPCAPALMGIAEPVIGRAFARAVGSTHPTTHIRVLAARKARGFASMLSLKRGSRECRVLAAPAVSRAKGRKKGAHEHTGTDGTLRHSLRNGFTAYIALSPENGSFASVIGGTPPANLTPAPRRQDHTTSPYASVTLVRRDISVHRISLHVRDDREAPFIRRETRGVMPLICPTARDEYFLGEGWTDFGVICPSGCFAAHNTASRHCQRSEATHGAAC
jgi:hypothetical protein